VPQGDIVPFVISINPPGGQLTDGEQTKLPFEVLFRGVKPCANTPQFFTGTLDVLLNNDVVARKPVEIAIPPCPDHQGERLFSYSVKFVCGTQAECACECVSVRPGVYATEINIHNYQDVDVAVEKRFIPVVLAGAAVGREPRAGVERGRDAIVLPPHSATMDDCCVIARSMLGAQPEGPMQLTIGFLEITSKEELGVTAVYTVSSPSSGAVSIDVQQIQAGGSRSQEPPPPTGAPPRGPAGRIRREIARPRMRRRKRR